MLNQPAKMKTLATSFSFPNFLQHNVNPSTKTQNLTLNKKHSSTSTLETIFKSFDNMICTSLDLPLHPFNDPAHILQHKYAPVHELPPTACDVVEGALPSCLDGAYIRNGPNPQFTPRGPYHLFDGDGMLHMIRISQGNATLCSRYVQTYKYMLERQTGYAVLPSIFSCFNGVSASIARCVLIMARVLTGKLNVLADGIGTANTSVALIAGRLFALCESDLPYEVKVTSEGDVVTLGRHDFHASEPFLRMTAHPKIDPDTGETYAFKYDMRPPFLTFFRIDSDGRKQPDVPIFSMKVPSVIHDFAVTKHYAVFPDTQIGMSPMEILHGRSPVRVDPEKVPRLGIIPRDAKDEKEMWWIDVPGFNMLHSVNAWEEDEGNTIVIVASNIKSLQESLEYIELEHLSLEKITIDVKAKTFRRHPVCTKGNDFGTINPAYVGKKTRYLYAATTFEGNMEGVLKIDLSADCRCSMVGRQTYKPGYNGNEPFFVPKKTIDGAVMEEDDGYLLTYVYDGNSEESKFLVMDAKSPTLEIVAEVNLPHRVPCGFHGLFVQESDLAILANSDVFEK